MAKPNIIHSIEEQVEDYCKKQLQGIKYYTKTERINPEIEEALQSSPSKSGGTGTNYPDIKCLIETQGLRRIPVMFEVKGCKGNFIKAHESGEIWNFQKDKTPHYANIAKYAVNGAVHYAHAILNHTDTYKEAIAIGVNGYDTAIGRKYEIGVYYVSKENLLLPKKVRDYTDLSFLLPEHVNDFIQDIDRLSLSEEEIEKKKSELEDEIERKLKEINQMMHDKKLNIVTGSRVQLITGLVMAGLGVPNKVSPLCIEDLRGDLGEHSNDGHVIMNKISDYLTAKNLPLEKVEMIKNVLNVVFVHSKLQEPVDGESWLHTLYREVKHNIMPFLTGELHNIDFTGRLFNVLNEWVNVPDGAENDVVLTPRYVTELMSKLYNVNMDSYVWDFATGSAGFLISAMHQMIADAKRNIKSPELLERKILQIKMEQLLGIETLPDIYLLAVLNMILMKDGCANIIHGDSLSEFSGNYEQGMHSGEKFPANVFLLNPPYSAAGKGFIFACKALGMMKGGMAAILIQENAGSGNGLPYTQDLLKHNTLLASIHMSDIFHGKASVQTAIYVFRVGIPHDIQQVVKFIDFSNDGFTRQNRKKSSQSVNLRNTGNARDRYAEVEKLVRFGRGINDCNLNYYKDCYIEGHITLNGDDWTYSQHKPINTHSTIDDFRNVIKGYLAWRISEIIKQDLKADIAFCISSNYKMTKEEEEALLLMEQGQVRTESFAIGQFFDIHPTRSYGLTNKKLYASKGHTPVVSNSSVNNGIGGWVGLSATEKGNMVTFSDTTTSEAIFYQPFDFIGYSHVQGLYPYEDIWNEEKLLYLVTVFRKSAANRFDYANKFTRAYAKEMPISLPIKNGEIDYEFMGHFIRGLIKKCINRLK